MTSSIPLLTGQNYCFDYSEPFKPWLNAPKIEELDLVESTVPLNREYARHIFSVFKKNNPLPCSVVRYHKDFPLKVDVEFVRRNGGFPPSLLKLPNYLYQEILAFETLYAYETPLFGIVKAPQPVYNETYHLSVLSPFCNQGDFDTFFLTEKFKKLSSENNHAMLYKWTFQLLKAVETLHASDVIHLDIKLENMLCHDNNLYLGDFEGALCPRSRASGVLYTTTKYLTLQEQSFIQLHRHKISPLKKIDIGLSALAISSLFNSPLPEEKQPSCLDHFRLFFNKSYDYKALTHKDIQQMVGKVREASLTSLASLLTSMTSKNPFERVEIREACRHFQEILEKENHIASIADNIKALGFKKADLLPEKGVN